jgi:hypothetical protein
MKIKLLAVSVVLGIIYICTGTPPNETGIGMHTDLEKASDNYYYNPSKICDMTPYNSRGAMVDQLTDCLAEEREWYKL